MAPLWIGAAWIIPRIRGLFGPSLDWCYSTWLEQLIRVLRNLKSRPRSAKCGRSRPERPSANAHGVSERDVVFLVRERAAVRSRVATESQSAGSGDLLSTSERPLDREFFTNVGGKRGNADGRRNLGWREGIWEAVHQWTKRSSAIDFVLAP